MVLRTLPRWGKRNGLVVDLCYRHAAPTAQNFGIVEINVRDYRSKSSQGFNPVCFLNAVEKCEIEE